MRHEPEFSYPVNVAHLPAGGSRYEIAASAEACAGVAAKLGVPAVKVLRAVFTIKAGAGALIHVEGQLHAELVQRCVVSLVPVDAVIDEAFSQAFVTADEAGKVRIAKAEEAAVDVGLDGDEAPEAAPGGEIDLGDLAVAQLALVLDPYPRAPGVAFEAGRWAEHQTPESGPFAALAKLKQPKD